GLRIAQPLQFVDLGVQFTDVLTQPFSDLSSILDLFLEDFTSLGGTLDRGAQLAGGPFPARPDRDRQNEDDELLEPVAAALELCDPLLAVGTVTGALHDFTQERHRRVGTFGL